MSRTFRRKGYEQANIHWKNGTKTAGFYTVSNGAYNSCRMTGEGLSFRKPTRKEHNREFYRIHSESKTNLAWSPNRYYRNYRIKENHILTKTELFKYMKDTEYEVMVEANPRSCLWDWS